MKRTLLLLTILTIAAGGLAVYYLRPPAPPKSELPPEALQVLRESHQMTLFSIDPEPLELPNSADRSFHGYRILGETVVADSGARQRVVQEILQAVAASDGPPYMCFNPRHGIRATQDSETFDFLICFECDAIYTFADEERIDSAALHGSGVAMNAILQTAGIPLAPAHE